MIVIVRLFLLLLLLLLQLLEQLFIRLGVLHSRVESQGLIIGFDSSLEIASMGQCITAIIVCVGTVKIEEVIDC